MDILTVSKKIQDKINLLEQGRQQLEAASLEKATTIAQYDKQLAITLIRLTAGKPVEIDGEVVKDVPATIREKIAKGICWKECLEKEKADAMYKSITSKMQSIESELNGWQSINRYLDKTT